MTEEFLTHKTIARIYELLAENRAKQRDKARQEARKWYKISQRLKAENEELEIVVHVGNGMRLELHKEIERFKQKITDVIFYLPSNARKDLMDMETIDQNDMNELKKRLGEVKDE